MKKRVPSEKEISTKHGVSVKYVIRQAEIGSTVEREHTTSHEEAYGIALQHIAEFPDYYKHLLSMEKQLKKKWNDSKKIVKEDHKEIASGKIKDDEGYMANLELDQIERSVAILRKLITKPDQQLPAWVQSKITRAADFIDTAAEYLSSDEEVSEGVISNIVDKMKGRKQVGTTASGGKVYVSTKPKSSKVKYPESPKKKETPKKPSSIDHDDPWLKSSSGAEKKAHYRQLRGEELNKSFEMFMLEASAWTKKEGKNKNGGLNEKGRKSYEAENPGSDLKAPSKKVGNPRRASFCSRMKGMKSKLTSAKTANDPDSRINKSLRAWNC
jgi:hypothetical protein